MTDNKERGDYITTVDLYNLDLACRLIYRAFGDCPYLVGSCAEGRPCRDVDVRLILDDDQFDHLFRGGGGMLWELLCVSIGDYLRQRTGLPIDFQIQRFTEANAKHKSVRNPLGLGRRYAALGDGTPEWIGDRTGE